MAPGLFFLPRSVTLGRHDRAQRGFGLTMKTKTKHRKGAKWRKSADSSPVAKGRKPKLNDVRNPRKKKHAGGKGL